MNDFSNVKNNMGVEVEYYYLLQPKNWKIGIFMVSIIKKKKLTKFCSNLNKKKPNQISSQNMLSNEFYFFNC